MLHVGGNQSFQEPKHNRRDDIKGDFTTEAGLKSTLQTNIHLETTACTLYLYNILMHYQKNQQEQE